MDVYLYRAALWCGPCVAGALIANGVISESATAEPAEALQLAVLARGFKSESDYDSDDLPKGPYPDGGGEADIPQHCDGCGCFLENPLTKDGLQYVRDAVAEFDRSGRGSATILQTWREAYPYAFERSEETAAPLPLTICRDCGVSIFPDPDSLCASCAGKRKKAPLIVSAQHQAGMRSFS